MRSSARVLLAGWLGQLLTACASYSATAPVPAILIRVDAASRTELQKVVDSALGRTGVLLAGDALSRNSELIIEPVQLHDEAGRSINGRELRPPEHFQLMLVGTRCFLRHERTSRRYFLAAARCAPEAKNDVGT